MCGKYIINATIIQASPKFGEIEIHENSYIGVNEETGKIEFIVQDSAAPIVQEWTSAGASITTIAPPKFLIPGFIDAHIHAPQYSFTGVGTNIPLLDWLNNFTFPFESKFSDLTFAKAVYDKVVQRTLACGTTTASYFATVHTAATLELAKICAQKGQRAFIGKVNMDRNSPDFYRDESTASSIKATEDVIEGIRALGSPIVAPIVTPRFVPTCTAELMTSLGKIASQHNDAISKSKALAVQSHVSENRSEIAWVAELHPECASYTDVYRAYGLLGRRTILAHGIHLSDAEIDLFGAAGASVVHCPLSNFSLTSGVCPVRKWVNRGIHVALGTDVCGGGSPSMHNAMKNAIIASQVTFMRGTERNDESKKGSDNGDKKEDVAPLGWKEALFLATRGGAYALDIEDVAGSLERGKDFDALVIDPEPNCERLFDIFGWESVEQIAEKYVVVGDDRNIAQVFVHGRKVVSKY